MFEYKLDLSKDEEIELNKICEEHNITIEEFINLCLLNFINNREDSFEFIKKNRTDKCITGKIGKPLFKKEDDGTIDFLVIANDSLKYRKEFLEKDGYTRQQEEDYDNFVYPQQIGISKVEWEIQNLQFMKAKIYRKQSVLKLI